MCPKRRLSKRGGFEELCEYNATVSDVLREGGSCANRFDMRLAGKNVI